MTATRTFRTGLLLTALLFSGLRGEVLAQEPAKQQEIELDHGIVFTLPAEWAEEDRDDTRRGDKGRLRVAFECLTDACIHTQETCAFVLRAKPVEGRDDRERLASLYGDPYDRYERMRSAAISTSKDAQFRQQMQLVQIGGRDWYVIETDARHNMKSGLFAETVIDGWHLTVTCKTCEQSEVRHRQGRDMLASLRQR